MRSRRVQQACAAAHDLLALANERLMTLDLAGECLQLLQRIDQRWVAGLRQLLDGPTERL